VFVVALQLTKEEEELQKQRVSVKRGLPLQDLQGKRGFPGMYEPPPKDDGGDEQPLQSRPAQ